MKQHIAVFTLGLSLLTSCMTDSAYRKVENGLVADIRSGQAKAVKLEVISDDIIRVIASPDGKFSNQVNLIKDTKSLPAPSFQITTSGDTIIVSTQTTQARLSRETGEVSIHAPTRGATSIIHGNISCDRCFNPRTHTGCD